MSHLIIGSTQHTRFSPQKHTFKYPVYMLYSPLSRLKTLGQGKWYFGYNRRALVSIYDRDYLHTDATPLSEKTARFIDQFSQKDAIDTVVMVAIPRLILASFRPVSFYLCYTKDRQLIGLLAEVTNTYKETHVYPMEITQNAGTAPKFSAPKSFHVSPFFDDTGEYCFRVEDTSDTFGVHIDYTIEGAPVFYANFVGRKRPFSAFQALRLLMLNPLTALLVYPRILVQAAKLYYLKKLPARSKPKPSSPNTIRPMPLTRFQRKILNRVEAACQDLPYGKLTLKLPDGTDHAFGAHASPNAQINVTNTWFFKSVELGGEIGLGESYMRGEWESPNLPLTLEFLTRNMTQIEAKFAGSFWVNLANKLRHRFRKNTHRKSKQNISEHYDLGNTFYRLFLDDTMMYSAAVFDSESDTLEMAQKRKADRLIDGLNLQAGAKVLEIGSGWGYVATTIAQRFECHVTTITLSEEQRAHTQQLVADKGLSDRVDVRLLDYRAVQGAFDAIISIEMIEAVGHDYLPTYFQHCNRLLKPGGRFALQAITFPNDLYDHYRNASDFIRKHIFPGGHMPSLGIIESITQSQTQLRELSRVNIAQSYAKTLSIWRDRFLTQKPAVEKLAFSEEFFRKWEYYLAYCEAAFRADYLGSYQIIFEKQESIT